MSFMQWRESIKYTLEQGYMEKEDLAELLGLTVEDIDYICKDEENTWSLDGVV